MILRGAVILAVSLLCGCAWEKALRGHRQTRLVPQGDTYLVVP